MIEVEFDFEVCHMLFDPEDIPQMKPPALEQARPRVRRKRTRKPQQLCLLEFLALELLAPEAHKQAII